MYKCCVPDCRNSRSTSVALFRMPDHPEEVRNKWVDFLKNSGMENIDRFEYLVCEIHFEAHLIKRNENRKTLLKNSYPSINNYAVDDDDSNPDPTSSNRKFKSFCCESMFDNVQLKNELAKYCIFLF